MNIGSKQLLMPRPAIHRWMVSGLALLALLLVCTVASACPGCKEALEKQDPTHGGMAKGYYYSILFMMTTPYLLIGVFGGVMYIKIRRKRAQQNVIATAKKTEPRMPRIGTDVSSYPRPSA
jgi:hypothetical protein